jgi:CBS domain containing-hemolysin-like protein
LPVYVDSIDSIVGYLHVRQLFKFRESARSFVLRDLLQPPIVVPETRSAADLLEDMRKQRSQMAIVVDEYGGTSGIITLADLLETLVGRIDDEPNVSSMHGDVTESDGSIALDGRLRLHEFEEIAEIRLDEELSSAADTLGGLVVMLLGRFPQVGERVVINGRVLIVDGQDGHRVEALRLLPVGSRSSPDVTDPK